MKYIKILGVFLVLAVMAGNVKAQKNYSEEADKAFDMKQYSIAIELYDKAYSKVKGNKAEKARIIYQTALSFMLMNDTKKAEVWFKKAAKINYEDPLMHLYYGDVLKINGKYDEAIVEYQIYQEKAASDPRGASAVEACKLSVKWVENPTRYEIENMKQFNSKQNDFSPCFADRKFKSLIFTTDREEVEGNQLDAWTGGNFTDLFMTTVDRKGKWSTPIPVGEPINSKFNEGAATMNSKANEMFFTRCEVEKKKQKGCDIWDAGKKGPNWDMPVKMVFINDSTSAYVFGHPSISDDELTLYFVSDMPGGIGGKDIWKVTRDKKSKPWGSPINLGPTINTANDEMYPYIHENGNLYFSSNGHMGLGGLDIFKTEANTDGTFKTPENLKYPMNSSADDFGIIFEGPSTDFGYFTSGRVGGRGGDDIYRFVLPPLVFTMKGVVTDDSTKRILKDVLVEMKGSDGTVVYDTTDATGLFEFDKSRVKPNTTYTLSAKKNKYLTIDKSIAQYTTVGLENSKDLKQDLAIIPIPKQRVVLPDILYGFNEFDLKPQYQDSLNGLFKTLKQNEGIVVELSSHTDARGGVEYNDTLSMKRAQSVVDYLIKKGIPADRMKAMGYGKRQPRTLASDKVVMIGGKPYRFPRRTKVTEDYINGLKSKDEQEAAHQLNRRTEFEVLRDDYVPTEKNKKVEPIKIEIINGDENKQPEPQPATPATKPATGTQKPATTPAPGTKPATTPGAKPTSSTIKSTTTTATGTSSGVGSGPVTKPVVKK